MSVNNKIPVKVCKPETVENQEVAAPQSVHDNIIGALRDIDWIDALCERESALTPNS
jgi:hypothetical protein